MNNRYDKGRALSVPFEETMAKCKKCGAVLGKTQRACPQCGTPFQKKNRAPVVVLILLLVLLVGGGGVYTYFWYRDHHPRYYKTFDMTCGEYSSALSRLLEEEGRMSLRIDERKWVESSRSHAMEYDGGSFVIRAKTAEDGGFDEKLRELRIGSLATEDGVQVAAMSVLALEQLQTKDVIFRDIEALKNLQRDKVSYRVAALTYDRDNNQLVLAPSTGAKSPEHYGTTADSALSLAAPFVSGNRFLCAGGKYIFSDGSRICRRDQITGSNTQIVAAENDGRLLSDGKMLFYVTDTGDSRKVFSVRADGSGNRMLMNLAEKVTLLHVYNNCLYYATESAAVPQEYAFCRYHLDTGEAERFNDIRFDPERAVVDGNLLYCTAPLAADATADSTLSVSGGERTAVYLFRFDTEAFTELIPDSRVSAHGFYNGAGTPCFESCQTDAAGAVYGDHYLYTVADGVPEQSPAVPVNALMWAYSPVSGKTVLCDNPNRLYYWFNRDTGELLPLALPEAGAFTFDLERPDDMYVCVSDEGRLRRLFRVDDGQLTECGFGGTAVSVGTAPVIVGGYVLDTDFNAYAITNAADSTTAPTSGAAAAGSSAPLL